MDFERDIEIQSRVLLRAFIGSSIICKRQSERNENSNIDGNIVINNEMFHLVFSGSTARTITFSSRAVL